MLYGAEREEVSESWQHTYDLSSTMIPNVSMESNVEEHFCKHILYMEIQDSRVRIWDIVILVPNLLFLLFIAMRFNRARLKLRATSSPIFLAFYALVICNILISVIRCVVSMTVNAAAMIGGKADKVLWVTVRFFLLCTEMSVIIFGLAFGHLDSHSSIRRVLLVTSLLALIFTITQGTLELVLPDDTFHIPSRDFYVFGHGGMMFWFCSSLIFAVVYSFILILPWTRLRNRLTLPTRRSFYVYVGLLATLNLVQSIGAGLLNYTQDPVGLCLVDLTAAIYLTLFTPFVYYTFLSGFFGVSQPTIMFSYKAQVDDAMDEDTVSLPHQQSFSSLKTDSDYIYQVHTPSIHVPLYDPQTFSRSSKQGASLHSLTSTKGRKSSYAASYDSRVALYHSTSDVKRIDSPVSTEKGISELVQNYPLIKSNALPVVQKSVPDLRNLNPIRQCGSAPITCLKYYAPGNVSSFVSPSDTASNFLYKPRTNDSNVNLFPRTRKSSLETLDKTVTLYATLEKTSRRHSSCLETPALPLENTLQSILDSGTFKTKTENLQRFQLKTSNIDKSDNRAGPSHIGAEFFKVHSDDTLSGMQDILNVTQQLLPASTSSSISGTKRKSKSNSKGDEQGGLSDYLLSITSPKIRRLSENDDNQPPYPFRGFHTQTESL